MSKLKFFMIQTVFDLIYPTAMWYISLVAADGTIINYDKSAFNRTFAPAMSVYAILNAVYLINGRKNGVYDKARFTLLGFIITLLGILFLPVGILLLITIMM